MGNVTCDVCADGEWIRLSGELSASKDQRSIWQSRGEMEEVEEM